MKLGRFETNNIYNEDSYKAIKDIPDKSIDLVYIDIPYDISYSGGGCLQKNLNHNIKDMNKSKETLLKGIDYSIFNDLCRVMKNIYIYIWCSKSQVFDIMKYFVEKKGCYYQFIFWGKTNPVPFGSSPFLSDKEICLCFYENAVKFNSGIENKSTYYISGINMKDKELYEHPTIKPLEFVKKHILNTTKENDVVLDCFMGSGTTAVACKELNRQFIGFEIDSQYYKLATDRLKGISKIDRQKKENGQLDIFSMMEE